MRRGGKKVAYLTGRTRVVRLARKHITQQKADVWMAVLRVQGLVFPGALLGGIKVLQIVVSGGIKKVRQRKSQRIHFQDLISKRDSLFPLLFLHGNRRQAIGGGHKMRSSRTRPGVLDTRPVQVVLLPKEL